MASRHLRQSLLMVGLMVVETGRKSAWFSHRSLDMMSPLLTLSLNTRQRVLVRLLLRVGSKQDYEEIVELGHLNVKTVIFAVRISATHSTLTQKMTSPNSVSVSGLKHLLF